MNSTMCYGKLNDRTNVFRVLDDMLNDEPANVKALYQRGYWHFQFNDFDAALVDFEQLIKIAPNHKHALEAITKLKKPKAKVTPVQNKVAPDPMEQIAKLMHGHKFTEAVNAYNELELNNSAGIHKLPIYLNKSFCYIALKDYNKVIEECTKALKIDPQNTRAFFRRAFAHSESGNIQLAVADVKKVIELDSEHSRAIQLFVKLKDQSNQSTASVPVSQTLSHHVNQGIRNSGNTCYLNVLLQAIFSINCLRFRIVHDTNNGEVFKYLRKITAFMQLNEGITETGHLCRLLGAANNLEMNDFHEILNRLLNEIDNECSGSNKPNPFDIFTGYTIDRIYFDYQGVKISEKVDKFMTLELAVENSNCLRDAFASFTATEQMTGKNQYEFRKGSKIDATKTTKFSGTPDVLVILLKRYKLGSKCNHRFEFDKILDVTKFTTNPTTTSIYHLLAIIAHAEDAQHYMAYVRPNVDATWFLYNDATVSQVTEVEAINDNFGNGSKGFNAYGLVYVKAEKQNEIFCPINKCDVPLLVQMEAREFKECEIAKIQGEIRKQQEIIDQIKQSHQIQETRQIQKTRSIQQIPPIQQTGSSSRKRGGQPKTDSHHGKRNKTKVPDTLNNEQSAYTSDLPTKPSKKNLKRPSNDPTDSPLKKPRRRGTRKAMRIPKKKRKNPIPLPPAFGLRFVYSSRQRAAVPDSEKTSSQLPRKIRKSTKVEKKANKKKFVNYNVIRNQSAKLDNDRQLKTVVRSLSGFISKTLSAPIREQLLRYIERDVMELSAWTIEVSYLVYFYYTQKLRRGKQLESKPNFRKFFEALNEKTVQKFGHLNGEDLKIRRKHIRSLYSGTNRTELISLAARAFETNLMNSITVKMYNRVKKFFRSLNLKLAKTDSYHTLSHLFDPYSKFKPHKPLLDALRKELQFNGNFRNLHKKWWNFIPFTFRLQQWFIRSNIRTFKIFPIMRHRRHHVQYDSQALQQLLRNGKWSNTDWEIFKLNLDEVWQTYFDVESMNRCKRRSDGKKFHKSFTTDGVTACVRMNCPKSPQLSEDQEDAAMERIRQKYLAGGYKQEIGIDPGSRLTIAAVQKSVPPSPNNVEVMIKYSSASYRFDTGEHRRSLKLRKWTNEFLKRINNYRNQLPLNASSTADPTIFLEFELKHFTEWQNLMTQKKITKLRLQRHCQRRKVIDALTRKIVQPDNSKAKSTIIYVGNTKQNDIIKGYVRTPDNEIMKSFSRFADIIQIPEHRSTMLCSICYIPLTTSKSPHRWQHCGKCKINWNRDINGANNIVHLGRSILLRSKIPNAFSMEFEFEGPARFYHHRSRKPPPPTKRSNIQKWVELRKTKRIQTTHQTNHCLQ